MVDEQGRYYEDRTWGQLNGTPHKSVLRALSHRFQAFRIWNFRNSEHLWSVDEAGTIDTRNIGRLNLCETVQQEISEVNAIELPDETLKVHGNAPPPKAEGTIRLIYENVNGFPNRLSDKEKIGKARDLHDELEVDIAAYCKHRLNMRHKKNHNGFNLLFNGGEAAI